MTLIAKPPRTTNAEGKTRLVGVEIEFANVDVSDGARIIEDIFGGTPERESEHLIAIRQTAFGTFQIELDWQGAHKDPGATETKIKAETRAALGDMVAGLVPTEIVCPPIPWDRLDVLDPLFSALRRAGAKGTEDGVLYGFGLHLNPEVAEQSADYTLRHLQAYVILEDWLREEIDIDVMRRALPHIDPFPASYLKRILDADYRPDLQHLIRDYVSDNQTRNRGLDLMPLFRHLDEATLMDVMADMDLIKARPTFHYRLPNSELSKSGWNAVVEWNRWVEVEKLAADEERLARELKRYADWLGKPMAERWVEKVRDWLA